MSENFELIGGGAIYGFRRWKKEWLLISLGRAEQLGNCPCTH